MRTAPSLRIAGLLAVALAALTTAGGQAIAGPCFSVGPGSGAAGTTVTISALTGLSGTASVTFGGVSASILSVSNTAVQVTVPTEPTPTVSSAINESFLTFGFNKSPGVGPTAGGNTVQITGSNFNPTVDVAVAGGSCAGTDSGAFTYNNDVTGVTIGGTPATGVSVINSTTISVTAPPGVPGAAGVVVNTTNTHSAISNVYTYADGGPSVTSITPTFGLTSGGNSVTISGSGFLSGTLSGGSTATTVTIGGTPATHVVINSALLLTATAPPGSAGAADVVVTTPAGNSGDQYLYLYVAPAQPVVQSIVNTSSMSPYVNTAKGTTQGGDNVTITGSNFAGATAVTIGGNVVTSFTINGPGSISTTTPAHIAGTVDVSVTVPSASPTTGTGSGLFTYAAPAPTLSGIVPNSGNTAGGTAVTIVGSFLTGTSSVMFGTTSVGCPSASCAVSSDNQVLVTTPAHAAGPVTVTVTTPAGSANMIAVTPTSSVPATFTYGTAPPAVTSVTPNSGGIAGGNTVTISGSGFTGADTGCTGPAPSLTPCGVNFGNAAIAPGSFSVTDDAHIKATAPMHAVGVVNVTVTTSAGSGTGGVYNYTTSPPTVASISTTPPTTPPSGPTQGGTLITIMGTFFSGQPQVTVGGVQASGVALISATEIQALTPAGTGTKDVVVTTSYGSSITSAADQFTYTTGSPPTPPAPTIGPSGISPATGPTAGGQTVTITGTGLTGASLVTFNGIAATKLQVVSDSQITATTPPHAAGPATVVVTTPGGTVSSTAYVYIAVAPTVTSITANTGTTKGGTFVTITGTNFMAGATVTIGTAPTNVTVVSATTITATTAAHAAGPVNVVVTTTAGTGTGTNLFTYVAQPVPTVTAISPSVGPIAGGTAVTITGTNFTGTTAVTIGGAAATLVVVLPGATSITAVTPPGAAGAANVVVTTPAGTGTGTGLFTYDAAPTVTGVSPAIGVPAGGYTVTISGTNFVPGATVKFGNTAATSFTVVSGNLITVTVPAGTGAADVTVTTPGGTSVITAADKFTYAPVPTVTSVAPNGGSPGGGTLVTITGTGFTGATTVMFGTTSATVVSVNGTGTMITVTSPPGTGTVNVMVTAPGGTSATTPAGQFSYGKIATTLTLTSSPNPSVLGQVVTFTATVTGHSPSGPVTFSEGGKQIGSASLTTTSLTTSIATFAISSLPVGADVVTASYGGDANNAADPEAITQYVNAPSDSAKLRQMQVAVMPIVANLWGQDVTGAMDNAIGDGFSGTCAGIPTSNGSGVTYCFGDSPQAQTGPTSGQQQARAGINGGYSALGYADTPAGTAPAAPPNTVLAADMKPTATRPPVAQNAPPREWLAWIDLRGADFDRNSVGNDLKGLRLDAITGLTRRFSSEFLVGVLGGYEHFDFTSQAYNGVLTGQGFTAGAYLGWRVTPGLRFTAGAAWADLLASSTAGAASGNFTGQRWLGFGGLTGNYGWGGLKFEPSAQLFAVWERENAYVDSFGTQQASHNFDTGRASSGLKIAHPFAAGEAVLTPYAGLYGDYYFSMDNATTIGLTTVPMIQGWGARATGGLTATLPSGAQVSAGGELSGIGNDTHIWTMTLRASVPF